MRSFIPKSAFYEKNITISFFCLSLVVSGWLKERKGSKWKTDLSSQNSSSSMCLSMTTGTTLAWPPIDWATPMPALRCSVRLSPELGRGKGHGEGRPWEEAGGTWEN